MLNCLLEKRSNIDTLPVLSWKDMLMIARESKRLLSENGKLICCLGRLLWKVSPVLVISFKENGFQPFCSIKPVCLLKYFEACKHILHLDCPFYCLWAHWNIFVYYLVVYVPLKLFQSRITTIAAIVCQLTTILMSRYSHRLHTDLLILLEWLYKQKYGRD